MTIRRTLLGAFLLVGMTPSVILTYLSYVQTRDALRHEVETSLEAQAASVSVDIDHLLFERLQNALGWNRLDVMQDIRINDVDKRLSQFLAEVKASYGDIYRELYCVDANGRIVASSAPQLIGGMAPPVQPWLDVTLSNGSVALDALQLDASGVHRVLPLRIGIISATDGAGMGELVLLFDWRQIDRILDGISRSGRMAVLLDGTQRAIDSSEELRRQDALSEAIPQRWDLPAGQSGAITREYPQLKGPAILGFSRSQDSARFPGLRWTTVVLQPSATALAVVQRMRFTFSALLLATLLLTAIFAGFVARQIAQPIARLTEFTRRFSREQKLPPVPEGQRGEVGELTEAFVKTVRELDRSRQDFLRASRLAVAGEIAAVMAHEVRTPLGILRSSAQVLREEPHISAEGRELVGFIDSETERINRLVTSVLDSAKPHPPVLGRHDLGLIVHRCILMLGPQAEKRGVSLEEGGGGGLQIDCDEEQMTQVVLNLLLNAVQILPSGGRVRVECSDRGENVHIQVEDDGPGISPVERANIFEPFISKRPGGLGLGLAVVKQIVLAHHGDIEIGESRWGGALFSIHLPRNVKP
ncbi:sensor histidine kinase [Nevskia soli]|uniref:sensor histidine kinase n=1 Tax=Nevskia soli TaxID=418856 RepID=UPI0004A761F6|nr:sensor histidine kinase [Nevskia soli]